MTRGGRPARVVALLGLLLVLSGCALLAKDEPLRTETAQGELRGDEQRPGGEPPAPTPNPDNLVIDAPSELRTLLLRNLDLARLVATADPKFDPPTAHHVKHCPQFGHA